MTDCSDVPVVIDVDGDEEDEERILEILTSGGIKSEAISFE